MKKFGVWIVIFILALGIAGCGEEEEPVIGPSESSIKIVTGLSGDEYMNTKFGIRISNLPVDEWSAEDYGADGQGMLLQPEAGFINLYLLLLMEPVPEHQFIGPGEGGYLNPVAEANIPFICIFVDYEKGITFETSDLIEILDIYVEMWFYEMESRKPVYVGDSAGIQAILTRGDEKSALTWFAKKDLLVRAEYWAREADFDKHFATYEQVLGNILLMGT